MTHYTVGIIVPPNRRYILSYIDRQMAPYDENLGRPNAEYDDDDDYVVNPNARWDWYRIGGRWDGWITDNRQSSDNGFNFGKLHESLENNIATTETALDKNRIPHAIITPDGEWHERGVMGWFAVISNERPDWEDRARELLRQFPGHSIVILDAHI
jgi:hypothetical protein